MKKLFKNIDGYKIYEADILGEKIILNIAEERKELVNKKQIEDFLNNIDMEKKSKLLKRINKNQLSNMFEAYFDLSTGKPILAPLIYDLYSYLKIIKGIKNPFNCLSGAIIKNEEDYFYIEIHSNYLNHDEDIKTVENTIETTKDELKSIFNKPFRCSILK